jgi:hypothetical protein
MRGALGSWRRIRPLPHAGLEKARSGAERLAECSDRLAGAIRRARIRSLERRAAKLLEEGYPTLARQATLEAQVLKYAAKRRGWL